MGLLFVLGGLVLGCLVLGSLVLGCFAFASFMLSAFVLRSFMVSRFRCRRGRDHCRFGLRQRHLGLRGANLCRRDKGGRYKQRKTNRGHGPSAALIASDLYESLRLVRLRNS